MANVDRVAYIIKTKAPALYGLAASLAQGLTVLFYNRAIARGRQEARIEGEIHGRTAVMRTLIPDDLDAFVEMIESIPEDHLAFFHPHRLDAASMAKVIRRKDMVTYGLFRDGRMEAYVILKLFPTRKAYLGRLVSSDLTGLGIGRFLSRFLYWQAGLMGFQPCSTIHKDNVSSMKSHAAVRPFYEVAELQDGYRLVRFELLPEDNVPPVLMITRPTSRKRT